MSDDKVPAEPMTMSPLPTSTVGEVLDKLLAEDLQDPEFRALWLARQRDDVEAAVERGRQQGWREGLEQAARNAEGQPDTAPALTPRQVAVWLRLYASSSVAPTEGSQTDATA